MTFDGTTLAVNPTASSTASTISFGSGDNATIAAYYSMTFQVNSSNTQTGRTYNWNKAGTGYGNGTNLMYLAADTNVLYNAGSINSKAYSIPGQSGAGTYQYGLTNSPTWNVNQGSYTNNNSTAPDGSTTAATYTLTATSWDLYQTIAVTSGVVYKVGVWVKLGTATNFCIVINNTQSWNTIGGKAFTSSDGLSTSKWTHVSYTFTGTSTGNINLHIGGHSESITQQTAGTVFVWNWEVTTGNSTWVSNIDDEVRLSNTSIFTSRGLLGLGTYSPSARIHISSPNSDSSGTYYSQLRIDGTGTYPDNIAGISLNPAAAVQSHIRFLENGTAKVQIRFNEGGSSDNKLKIYSWTTGTDFVTFSCSNGYVGIGTTSPASLLHTATTSAADNEGHIKYENTSTGTGSAANAQLIGKSKYGTLQYMVWETYGARVGMRSTANGGSGNLYFTTGSDSVNMTLNSTGLYVGGSSLASTTLHVNGTSYIGTMTSYNAAVHIRGGYYGGPRLQVYGLDSDSNAYMGLGTDMGGGPYELSIYSSNYAGYGIIRFGRFTGGNGTQYSGWTSTGLISTGGTLTMSGDLVAYGSPSDIKFKENVQPLDNSLKKLIQLRGVSFTWKEETEMRKLTKLKDDIGFIAQEVQSVFPEIVRRDPVEDYLSIRDRGLIALMVESIKELNQKVEDQQILINSLLDKQN